MNLRDDRQSHVPHALTEVRFGVPCKARTEDASLFKQAPHKATASLFVHQPFEIFGREVCGDGTDAVVFFLAALLTTDVNRVRAFHMRRL